MSVVVLLYQCASTFVPVKQVSTLFVRKLECYIRLVSIRQHTSAYVSIPVKQVSTLFVRKLECYI